MVRPRPRVRGGWLAMRVRNSCAATGQSERCREKGCCDLDEIGLWIGGLVCNGGLHGRSNALG